MVSGPWEDFAPASSGSGPWEDFAPASPALTPASIGAEGAVRGIALPIQNPVDTAVKKVREALPESLRTAADVGFPAYQGLERAGEKLGGATQEVVGDAVSESARHREISAPGTNTQGNLVADALAGTMISTAAEFGKLTPSNQILNIANALMFGMGKASLAAGRTTAIPIPKKIPLLWGGDVEGLMAMPKWLGAGKTLPELASAGGQSLRAGAQWVDDILGIPKAKGRAQELLKALSDKITGNIGGELAPEVGGSTVKAQIGEKFGVAKAEASAVSEGQSQSILDKVIEDYNAVAQKFGKEPISRSEMGKSVRPAVKKTIDGMYQEQKNAYKVFDEVAPKQPATTETANGYIEEVFGRNKLEAGEILDNPQYFSQLSLLQSQYGMTRQEALLSMERMGVDISEKLTSGTLSKEAVAEYKRMAAILNKLDNPNLTVQDLTLMRTEIGNYAYRGAPSGTKETYKGLYGALTEDINRAAEAGGFLEETKNARALYKRFAEARNHPVTKAILEGEPSKSIDVIKNSPEKIDMASKMIGSEGMKTVRRGMLDDVFTYATERGKTPGEFDPENAAKSLSKMTPEMRLKFFGEDNSAIDGLIKMLRSFDKKKSGRALVDADFAKMAGKVGGKTPSETLDLILSDPTNFDEALKVLDESGKSALRRAHFTKTLERSFSFDASGRRQLDPKKVEQAFEGLDKKGMLPRLKKLYGKDGDLIQGLFEVTNTTNQTLKDGILGNFYSMLNPINNKSGLKGIASKFLAPGRFRGIVKGTEAEQLVGKTFPHWFYDQSAVGKEVAGAIPWAALGAFQGKMNQ